MNGYLVGLGADAGILFSDRDTVIAWSSRTEGWRPAPLVSTMLRAVRVTWIEKWLCLVRSDKVK